MQDIDIGELKWCAPFAHWLRPRTPVAHCTACVGAQVSRELPPPLLGGYTVGEQVYFTGESHTFENGDWVEHGKQGEVAGPATSHRGKGVIVPLRFPGNKGAVYCYLYQVRRRRRRAATHSSPLPQLPLLPAHPRCVARVVAQVSREPPPPLPGGYAVGEQVYYTGKSETIENGYRLEHGKQGEVVGPATSYKGKGVDVRFPGNKSAISCWLTNVRRRRRRAATPTAPRRPCCLSS